MTTLASANPELVRLAVRVARYQRDFERFALEQLKIINKDKVVQPFTLYPFQQTLYRAVAAQLKRQGIARQIWFKSRQPGSSTLAQAILFWRSVLNQNMNAIVVAHDVGTAQTVFNMAKHFYERLDPAIQPMVRYSTKSELLFDNPSPKGRETVPGLGSKIVVSTARNIHSGAGGTFNLVQLSEAARYVNPKEIESSTLQAVPSGGGSIVIVESTARPEGFWFREMCDAARAGQSPYEFHFVGYNMDPTCIRPLDPGEVLEYEDDERELVAKFGLSPETIKWRRWKLAEMLGDVDTFNQEFPLNYEDAWITRESRVFPRDQLLTLLPGVVPPRFRGDFHGLRLLRANDGALAVWEEPQAGAMYDIGVDVALGVQGGDWSVAQVLKRPYAQQVAEYRAKIEPGLFAEHLNALGRWYNLAQIAVEVNNVGIYTNSELNQRLGYPNMYLFRRTDRLRNVVSNFLGWETTHKSKREAVARAKDVLYRYSQGDKRRPLVRSETLWRELSTYVTSDGETYGGAPNCHDDCVMAWVIALRASADEAGLAMGEVEETPQVVLAAAPTDPARYLMESELPWNRNRPSAWGDVTGW